MELNTRVVTLESGIEIPQGNSMNNSISEIVDPLVEANPSAQQQQLEAEASSFGISVARLLANRNNGRKSLGPKTMEGKKRSSLNSSRHSLTGQLVCKTREELEAQQKFLAEMMAECRPVGPSELSLTISLAENTVRLARVRQLEDGIFASGFRERVDSIDAGHPEVDAALADSETFLEHAKAIALLSTYEQRIRKALRDDRAELKVLQAERKAAYNQAREEAVKLAYYVQHNQEKDPDYDPATHFDPPEEHGGFVYNLPEIADWFRRKQRMAAAEKFYRTPKPAPSEPKTDLAA